MSFPPFNYTVTAVIQHYVEYMHTYMTLAALDKRPCPHPLPVLSLFPYGI